MMNAMCSLATVSRQPAALAGGRMRALAARAGLAMRPRLPAAHP